MIIGLANILENTTQFTNHLFTISLTEHYDYNATQISNNTPTIQRLRRIIYLFRQLSDGHQYNTNTVYTPTLIVSTKMNLNKGNKFHKDVKQMKHDYC